MILVDSREASSNPKIAEALRSLEIPVDLVKLEAGDYLIIGSERSVLVERKSVGDFVRSIFQSRLWHQLREMCAVKGASPLILVEGSFGYFKKFSRVSESTIVGSLWNIIDRWGVPTMQSPNLRYTVAALNIIHRSLCEKKNGGSLYPVVFRKKAGLSLDEQIRGCLEGIEGIGPSLAHKLLLKFRSVENIVKASMEELASVVGRKRAEKVFEVLHSQYRGGEDEV
jgi:ERCC4-type nuclease